MDEEPQQIEDDSSSTREIGEVKQWLQRAAGRSLGDVRVHDSTQAGELARRLGARAFTAGRHVYVRPELVRPFTRRGAALLAHEMWHAAGEPALQNNAAQPDMPLLSPTSRSKAGNIGNMGGAGQVADLGTAVQGQAEAGPAVNVQRAQPAGQGNSEASAQSLEAAAANSHQAQESKHHEQQGPDPEELAERVYRRIVRDLIVDRERAAY